MTANKHITPENGKQLTAEAAADAATILGIFRGHTQRMNRVFETLKARLAGRTEHEALYYLPKLKAALKAEGFNPGTLGRIWASTKWAVETGQPLETWATYMGKAGLDAAYEEHKKATRAAHDTGRKASEDKPEIDPEAEMDAAAERIEAAKAVRVNPYDAIIVLLNQLSEDELITLGATIEARLNAYAGEAELEEAA
jgi:hypothetical protein